MMSRVQVTIDGNEAAAYIAYKTNEVAAIYPITPSSAMGELADAWSAAGMHNLWGNVPTVIELQSEGGGGGHRAWRAADRVVDDDLYSQPGAVVDDSQHVQDRR